MPCIMIESGPSRGRCLRLGRGTMVIGRSEGLKAQIRDPLVSRNHAQIRFDADREAYVILDMNSSNGTLVNEERLMKEKRLYGRDVIQVGRTIIRFLTTEPQPAESLLDLPRFPGERIQQTVR